MDIIKESMQLPVDNFLGMLIYAVIYMLTAGVVASLALRFIPNKIPYGVKSVIVFLVILISIFLWWQTIIKPTI
ncbi:hypothetical protein SAMN04487944_114110 [Gracilibacillus ureilyticus]|uniref:Uncharacterized protein n=1 Tax=Gracilibacillus ureilyticus TaxID=531814 RepID=A0A1H9TPS9_9BACI|nr:hypothetical protein [Gracilibacillus ureilyticus]SER99068.1 hypothetical protein SAMN04487944_114110 [Gracilibacillus ureilyticus]